jgi:hypothetical protein
MAFLNPNDPANLTNRGVSSQGEVESPAEATAPAIPSRQWRENVPATSNVAGSDGICTAQIGPVANGQTWFVEWLRIKNTSTAATSVELFKNDPSLPLNSMDSSPTEGNDNWFSAPGSPGYWLGVGETLIVQWAGCNAGDVGSVNTQVLKNG